MGALEELSSAVSSVAATVGASVVRIGREGGRGAGFVTGEGTVITSAHNLRGSQVTVTFPGGRSLSGQVQGVDIEGDLAVVAVDTAGVAAVTWPAEATGGPSIGDAVFAVAALPAGAGPRVTVGHVSAVDVAFRGPRGRLIPDGFEHTAALGRGSSGGPVVDAAGNLIGVNTHRPGDGLYLAIPASAALKARVEALSRGESPDRRRLGVALTPAHVARRLRAAVGLPPRDGLLVREVADPSPAAAAGVQKGDLIVAVGGAPVESLDALMAAVDAAEGPLALTVVRGTDEVALEVRFEA